MGELYLIRLQSADFVHLSQLLLNNQFLNAFVGTMTIRDSDEEMKGRQEDMSNEHDVVDRRSPCSDGSSDESHNAKEVRKTNVSELVAKSKKAASSLWTLLHAKVRCVVDVSSS